MAPYIQRHAENTVRKLAAQFGAVLVTGARQVGKSTLLRHVIPDVPELSLDDAAVLRSATDVPELFFRYNTPPIFVDEVQRAPGLFLAAKEALDESSAKGLLYFSGSDQFEMMQGGTESLAGRVGILTLTGLSLREQLGSEVADPFVPTGSFLSLRRQSILPSAVWRHIHRGSMPELVANPEYDWNLFFGSYVRTYIERDVRRLVNVGDEMTFMRFMTVVAARTGGLLNLADIASEVGVSRTTAERWLSVLVTSHLVYLLHPYHTNVTKRAVKTAKLYFMDTGLAAYLTSWTSPEVIRDGAMAGAFFETFVVTEVLKGYYNAGVLDPPLYFYRDHDQREIDLLIVRDGVMYPIEIKQSALPTAKDTNAFRVLDGFSGVKRGAGGVICMADTVQPLTTTDALIPVSFV
ncbi:MAG: ATP-binding protein [Propionibacteriaceae bacterium]|jgi:predicted AAA+ superfamily ATPase|nr:ATP-binding protein [Propionibacteriaceae bacterium]